MPAVNQAGPGGPPVLFVIGSDYHLGDLVWLTAVLREFRRQHQPGRLILALPCGPIAQILEHNPVIDDLVFDPPGPAIQRFRSTFGSHAPIHDLRMVPIALGMVRDWKRYFPPRYYRDLWVQPRGQWLATYLGLGSLQDYRPVLGLSEAEKAMDVGLASPSAPHGHVVLAPHIGSYRLPFIGRMWRKIKQWDNQKWLELGRKLASAGYQPVTLGAAGQPSVPGTVPMVGLPVRTAAVIVERAAAVVTGESGLWLVSAAFGTPFVIVPWWLPGSVDWPAPMRTPHALVRARNAAVDEVLAATLAIAHPPAGRENRDRQEDPVVARSHLSSARG